MIFGLGRLDRGPPTLLAESFLRPEEVLVPFDADLLIVRHDHFLWRLSPRPRIVRILQTY